MKMRTLFATFAVVFGLSFTTIAKAQNCGKTTNYSISPYNAFTAITQGWLQWLNHGRFSCTKYSSTYIYCSNGSEAYNFYLNNNSTIDVYQVNCCYRDTAAFSIGNDGTVWSWSWDGGARSGYITWACTPDPYNPCAYITYGTCD